MYLNHEPIYNFFEAYHEAVTRINKTKFYYINSNLTTICTADDITDAVIEISDGLKDAQRNYKTKKNIDGNAFEIMIPDHLIYTKQGKPRNLNIINKNVIRIINFLKPSGYDLPYIYFIRHRGDGIYLRVLLVDREYYPQGKEINVIASSDWWIDPSTKKRVNAMNPNAELKYTKGTNLGTKIITWSAKVRNWSHSTIESLKHHTKFVISRLAGFFNQAISKSTKIPLLQNVSKVNGNFRHLKAIIYDADYWYLYRKNMAINRYISHANKVLLAAQDNADNLKIEFMIIIRKLKFTTVKNIKVFEDYVTKLCNDM